MSILVAGAGMNGVSAAIWLQRAGHDVVLIDRTGPAGGTSYGNAGVLASAAVIPVTVPGLWRAAPGMLLSPDKPLFLRWRYLPRLLPFLVPFLRHATMDHVRHYAKAMSALIYDSHAQHLALAKGTGAERFIGDEDYIFAYETRAAFDADRKWWDLRAEMGHDCAVMDARAFAEFDPMFDGSFEVAVAQKNAGRISDPGAYVTALCDHFQAQGGRLMIASVEGLLKDGDRVIGLRTSEGDVEGDQVVVTLGPWSGPLSRDLGLKVPLESERGYHIELINPDRMPKAPTMVASGKFVVTPMEGRIRMAGIVEFGGLTAPASKAPLDLLKRQARELFPGLKYDRMEEWQGHRPSTANSLPLIGGLDRHPNVLVGFGHQHLGLTGGAKTGRLLAQMVTGEAVNLDMSAYDPNAYARG